jgi:glycogen synthase
MGTHENVDYIFMQNETFFSIDPHPDNNSAQDGCYILNDFNINEVERFAFFSKAVYILLKELLSSQKPLITPPNILVANDWHSGAISGLTKYLSMAQLEAETISHDLAEQLKNIPVVHLAHHLGYQGWDYENTTNILNSLYENLASLIYRNAKPAKNSNTRTQNTLIVYDCYNQASCNFHIADRVVTVSKNYMEEVSKELDFGFDFRDILKIRKDHRNFFGIVNGYDKKLITPNAAKIESLNKYFEPVNFKFYDETHLEAKLENKKEFVKLISKIASDEEYKNKVIPIIDIYKFEDISKSIKNIKNTPIVCATSRLVEQKGYDIAAQAIINLVEKFGELKNIELPIFILGGAGNSKYFEVLTNLKDKVTEMCPKSGSRIFVFTGYNDSFAYAIQLASDFYMMPCRFEPCGLTQMEAMAKGTLPVAMSTGGLVDTIEPGIDGFRTEVFFSAKNRRVYGNNITAQRLKNNVNAYAETLYKALGTFYRHQAVIKQMKVNAMKKDFSWDIENGSIYKYYQLFKTGHI